MAGKIETTIKIYHNPRCRKSREGLAYLQSKTSNFQIVEYLKTGLAVDQIKEILLKANLKPFGLIRTQEAVYKNELKGRNFTDDEWIDIIVENPVLLRRPIVVGKHKAILAQQAEEIDKLLCLPYKGGLVSENNN
ncbi:MAG: arsenate reductase family protein [Bacteroidales bacterium]|nr:arsenate reductase family protein [Bacteroidales bacterium]